MRVLLIRSLLLGVYLGKLPNGCNTGPYVMVQVTVQVPAQISTVLRTVS